MAYLTSDREGLCLPMNKMNNWNLVLYANTRINKNFYSLYHIADFLYTLLILLALIVAVLPLIGYHYGYIFGQEDSLSDKFTIEDVVSGLEYPTGMTFLGPDDMLVIEQDKGTVQRIVSGAMLGESLLDVNVVNERQKYGHQEERGLLGLAITRNINKDTRNSSSTYVFLYYTEAEDEDGGKPLGNRLYRYELIDNKLINPKLLLDLPVGEDNPAHNGGPVVIGPDDNLYLVIGNLLGPGLTEEVEDSLDQNIENGEEPDGSGGILWVTQDGEVVNNGGILGDEYPLNLYYAYGIRNSFGITFDPIRGNLWDTENGGIYDEINLVLPGFNSGWDKIVGKSESKDNFDVEDDLEDFDGKGKYSDPEFSWQGGTAPTAIIFFHSDKLGREFENDIFVGSATGNIYNFDLTEDRTQLDLQADLDDKIADSFEESESAIVASNLGIITDLEVGLDGYLYGISYGEEGKIFRIIPAINE
jgi:aldose sugar dehydrogenase